jgi:hypothetical protein
VSPRKPKSRALTFAEMTGSRTAKTLPVEMGDERRPIFSFRYADSDAGEFAFSPFTFEAGDPRELLDFMCSITGSTWTQVQAQMYSPRNKPARQKHHYQGVDTLAAQAQARIVAAGLEEVVNEVFRFRLGSTKRLWGFVADAVFYVLWWDRDHKVYPVDRN